MPTLEQEAGLNPEQEQEQEQVREAVPMADTFGRVRDFVLTETGEGEYRSEEYMEHPLNFNRSAGVAQMLRGLTGFVGGSLRLAVLDVVFGFMRWRQENQKGAGDGGNYGPPV